MRLRLVCFGRMKDGTERALATRYWDRASGLGRGHGFAFELAERDGSQARNSATRRKDEATAARTAAAGSPIVAFDETGDLRDSAGFAELLGAMRDEGTTALTFVIGGADGLCPDLRADAAHRIAFGAMTWPHQLVRIMACEQLYRAMTILAGHPYHRG